MMRAIRIGRLGGPEVVAHRELPSPVPGPGEINDGTASGAIASLVAGSDLQRRALDVFAGLLEDGLTVKPSGCCGSDVEQPLAALADRAMIGRPVLGSTQRAATSSADHTLSILEAYQ